MPLGIDNLPSFMSTTNTHEAFCFSMRIKSPPLNADEAIIADKKWVQQINLAPLEL